jgi:hypothetical protein
MWRISINIAYTSLEIRRQGGTGGTVVVPERIAVLKLEILEEYLLVNVQWKTEEVGG